MKERRLLTYDVSEGQSKFPIVTFSLLIFFYVLGLILLDTTRFSDPFSYKMDTFIITFPETASLLTLDAAFKWQWQVLTYYIIHFALVHYGYSGLLMIYYLQGLEKATNGKIVFICFVFTGILAPIILGPIIYIIWLNFDFAKNFFIIQSYYMGSSVGIWGCMGLAAAVSRKRRFFWLIIFLLLFPEFYLKLTAGTGDLMANVIHVMVFSINWLIARRFFDFKNNNMKSGGLNFDNRRDLLSIVLFCLHAFVLIIHFIDSLGLFDQNLLSYLFE